MTPLYQKVKDHVRAHIQSGAWGPQHRVPSENELVKTLGVSRMTVNRALRELADEGLVVRIAGVGTFVADHSAHAHPLEIRNIADEIRARGHRHSSELIAIEELGALGELAAGFGVEPRTKLFHTLIVHHEEGLPIQVEDRYVNPAIAPGYMGVDFTTTTPHEYLIRVAPLLDAEHVLRAVMPPEPIRKLLAMEPGEPCLLVMRRTWTSGTVASTVRLYYPGSRYELSGRFKP